MNSRPSASGSAAGTNPLTRKEEAMHEPKAVHDVIAKFDAAIADVRTHLLHALGADEQQLAHDTEAAAKPLAAEVKQDAVNLAEETLTHAPAKPAETPAGTTTPPAGASQIGA